MFRSCFVFVGLVLLLTEAAAPADDRIDFVRDIRPILVNRCFRCHSSVKQESNLRLDTGEGILKGGDGGAIVLATNSEQSRLIQAVRGSGDLKMPPEGEPLTESQIALLKTWIDQGASAPPANEPIKHWSFLPPQRPALPVTAIGDRVSNAIDAFVAVKHSERKLVAVGPAPKHLLLRRVYLDLIGLPPSTEEVREFQTDEAPDQYERTIDRLLASPAYGERWGRHWMDVWRYSDWDGYGAEVRESQPHIWRWRDWIVESLNADKPYDQMILEMLAGDELAPDDPSTLRATGYLARSWYKFSRNVWLDQAIEHTGKAFLGVTFNCARCHDHMYDPIPQQEYYQLRAFFEPYDIRTDRVPGQLDVTKNGLVRVFDKELAAPTFLFVRGDEKQPHKDQALVPTFPKALRNVAVQLQPITLGPHAYYPGLHSHVHEESLAASKLELSKVETALATTLQNLAVAKQKLAEHTAKAATTPGIEPAQKPAEGGAATGVPAPPPNAETATLTLAVKQADAAAKVAQGALAVAQVSVTSVAARVLADIANYASPPADNAKELSLAAGRSERELACRQAERNLLEAEQKLDQAKEALKPEDEKTKKVVTDAEASIVTLTKARDDAQAALAQPHENYTRFSGVYPTTSTGRRLALARWIASAENPLTARVAVNHMWLRHFGQPLVPTVFDFGLNGKPPTHPELLDWLAVELQASAVSSPEFAPTSASASSSWRMKPLHRQIVTSATYRLSSTAGKADETNKANDPENKYLWRMNPHRIEAEVVRDATLHVCGTLDRTMSGPDLDPNEGLTLTRRSVYFRSSKEKKMTFLSLFDSANPVECYRRSESVAPQQALALANSPLTLGQARLLARSLTATVGLDQPSTTFVQAAYEQVLGRLAQPNELAECEKFLGEQAQRFVDAKSLTPFPSGSKSSVPPSADPQLRARENLVHVLLNHNDFVTVR